MEAKKSEFQRIKKEIDRLEAEKKRAEDALEEAIKKKKRTEDRIIQIRGRIRENQRKYDRIAADYAGFIHMLDDLEQGRVSNAPPAPTEIPGEEEARVPKDDKEELARGPRKIARVSWQHYLQHKTITYAFNAQECEALNEEVDEVR